MPTLLDIQPGLFNPSGVAPEKPASMSQEEWDRLLEQMRNQLRTQEFYASNPELQNIVPKSGGQLAVSPPAAPPPAAPPLPATQIPATAAQGLPSEIASQGASKAVYESVKPAAKSLLSKFLASGALVPAISAGAGVAGALIQKSAASNATKAEAEAADKALALTKEMYDQDRADMAPYRNIGAYSLGELGHLVGMPKDFGGQAVASATAPRTAIARDGGTIPNAPSVSPWKAITDNNPATRPDLRPELQSLRDLGATQQTASSFVRMRAPDGEEADVQPHEVPLFEAHGAMRI